jgi:hypothetical protein
VAVAADYVRIRESRGGGDSDSECARQPLDAQREGTTTWEVYDLYYADLCTHGERFVLGGRSCMRMSVSVE